VVHQQILIMAFINMPAHKSKIRNLFDILLSEWIKSIIVKT
jgi:hypothetical protein